MHGLHDHQLPGM